MRAVNLEVYINGSKVDTLFVESFSMNKYINKHGDANLTVQIPTGTEESCLNLASTDGFAEIRAIEEDGGSKTIFTGIVYRINVLCDYHESKLELELKSGTYAMDTVERTRSFQSSGTTYQQIVNFVNQTSGANCKFRRNGGNTIGSLKVQYKETDWEFILRMAAIIKQSIICEYQRTGIWYYIGLDTGQSGGTMDYQTYSIKKEINQVARDKKRGLPELTDKDALCYDVVSREVYQLGAAISFKGERLFVYQVHAEWNKEELVNQYTLRTEHAFLQPESYNEKLIGASLKGTVSSISKSQVSVSLEADSGNSLCGSRLFGYATIYSSASGTGWYCMPESGDAIRLYLPTADEADAYVMSSVHLDSSETSKNQRSDPDTKSIRSVHDKEVILGTEALTLTNNNGLTIILDDNEGITIESDKNITINAQDDIQIIGTNEIIMKADTQLELSQGNAKFTQKDNNIYMEGAIVKLQD